MVTNADKAKQSGLNQGEVTDLKKILVNNDNLKRVPASYAEPIVDYHRADLKLYTLKGQPVDNAVLQSDVFR